MASHKPRAPQRESDRKQTFVNVMETLASAGFTVPPASSIDALWARSTTVSCDANERLSLDLLSLLGELASFVDGKCDLPFVPTKPSQDSLDLEIATSEFLFKHGYDFSDALVEVCATAYCRQLCIAVIWTILHFAVLRRIMANRLNGMTKEMNSFCDAQLQVTQMDQSLVAGPATVSVTVSSVEQIYHHWNSIMFSLRRLLCVYEDAAQHVNSLKARFPATVLLDVVLWSDDVAFRQFETLVASHKDAAETMIRLLKAESSLVTFLEEQAPSFRPIDVSDMDPGRLHPQTVLGGISIALADTDAQRARFDALVQAHCEATVFPCSCQLDSLSTFLRAEESFAPSTKSSVGPYQPALDEPYFALGSVLAKEKRKAAEQGQLAETQRTLQAALDRLTAIRERYREAHLRLLENILAPWAEDKYRFVDP